MDREQFRRAGYAAIDRVCDYFQELESVKDVMSAVQPGDVGRAIPDHPPISGEPWSAIEADFDKVILPGITHWQHPAFLAYFPANSTYESILADIYAGAVSNPGFNWTCSPACTELEVKMMDWVGHMLGLDPSFCNSSNTGGGIIMGSASESCLTVCIAARERALKILPETRMENLVIYGTTQTHSLGAKAALILGVKFRAIPTRREDNWALRGKDLELSLEEDKLKGLAPFVMLLTLGSTSTGAVDNIAEVTAVAAHHPELFIHVDAAWAGVFMACPEFRQECQLDCINARIRSANSETAASAGGEVHSICTNLHKSGLVTFDASCLWIRDRKLLTEALDITPPFLRNRHTDQGTVIDYRNWQIALGRRFRSLKIYFVLRSYGVAGFQAHLRKLVDLATYFESLVKADASFESFAPRRFALVVFRLKASTEEESDKLNKAFFTEISERRDLHLTPTVVGGMHCTRVAVGSPLTTRETLDEVWRVIQEVAQGVRLVV